MELRHASESPDIIFGNLEVYLHAAPVNETLPAKTRSDQRLDQMYWDHEAGILLYSPVVILVHVRGDLLAVVRSGFAEEHVHLTDRTLGERSVDIMDRQVCFREQHLADVISQTCQLYRDIYTYLEHRGDILEWGSSCQLSQCGFPVTTLIVLEEVIKPGDRQREAGG